MASMAANFAFPSLVLHPKSSIAIARCPLFAYSSGDSLRWRVAGPGLVSKPASRSSSSRKIGLCRGGMIRAAQEAAAQAEAAEDEEEKEESSDEDEGPVSALEPLLEELKSAIASNDEKHVAKLEAQLVALQNERDSLGKQVNSLIEEVQTNKERVLRLSADFDNYRKRSENEKSKLASNVRGDVIETLLPMVDNFERAKSSIRTESEGEEKIDRSYQGIYKQFVEIMKGLGVVAVETVGNPFDPNLHEAIMREESAEFEEGTVIQEFRRGFSIGSKLVRPAMVKVSAGPPANKEEPGQTEVVVEDALQELTSNDTKESVI